MDKRLNQHDSVMHVWQMYVISGAACCVGSRPSITSAPFAQSQSTKNKNRLFKFAFT